MSFIKRFLRYISATGLSFSLFFLATALVLTLTLLSPTFIKRTLLKTNTYSNIVPSSLELAASSSSQQNNNEISPAVLAQLKPVVTDAVPASFVQQTTETVIDGTFGWLQGKTTIPQISVQTATVKNNLQQSLSTYIYKRLTSLEVCQKGTNYDNFDPLATPCRPPVALQDSEIQKYTADLIAQLPFLNKPEISLESLELTKAFASDSPSQKAPFVYSVAAKLPYILGLLAVICGVALVILSAQKMQAIRTVAHTFAWAGGILILFSALTLFFNGRASNQLLGSSSQAQATFVKTIFSPIISEFTKTAADYTLYLGVAYCFIGAILYVIARRKHENRQVDEAATKNTD